MDALDLILGGTCGGLVWAVLQLRRQIRDLRANETSDDLAIQRYALNVGASHTWKAQKRDASGRFA